MQIHEHVAENLNFYLYLSFQWSLFHIFVQLNLDAKFFVEEDISMAVEIGLGTNLFV